MVIVYYNISLSSGFIFLKSLLTNILVFSIANEKILKFIYTINPQLVGYKSGFQSKLLIVRAEW